MLKLNNSSSSSVNSDLAYGTGFIKRPKGKGIRSRKGKEINRENHRDYYRERETSNSQREKERSGVRDGISRATTDAEILAVGVGLAKLARDQNKLDLKGAKNGKRSDIHSSNQLSGYNSGTARGLGASKVSHGSDTVDEDGWESASDAESESSVDSRLAFGGDTTGGWFGFGRTKYKPRSRKSTIVDPRLFGRENSLNGVLTRPVGFGDVAWSSSSDFGQRGWAPAGPGPVASVASGSQASLQHVYPIPTSDPSIFEAARSSVVSGAEPYISSRPAPIPLQQPQPFAPVSQSVYEPTYAIQRESSVAKSPTSSGRGQSLAEAALMGVAGTVVGAAIASDRRGDRKDKRREDRDYDRSSEQREKRGSPDREERREKRRDKDKQRESVDDHRREKKREKRRDEGRSDGRDERREKRREEKRSERSDDRYETRRTKSEASVSTTPIQGSIGSVPTIVTVEREPNSSRVRSSSMKDQSVLPRSVSRRDGELEDEREQRQRGRDSRDRILRDAETIYQETEHFTAPIEVAAEAYRESRSDRRREERRDERREHDDYDSTFRKTDSAQEQRHDREPEREPERDPIQEEADRAYREIVMARKIASQVIRSRTPSPDRSVLHKYDHETQEEKEIIRIVTPPGLEEHKKEGPYDAPNADFKLDLVLEDPRELRNVNIPSISTESSKGGSTYFKRDPDASQPRPHLNLVRPTPTPSPMPEKQTARSEQEQPSKCQSQDAPDVVIDNRGNVVASPTSSSASKAVTWGENETKHYEVESPHEHRDEFVTNPEIQAPEKDIKPTTDKSPNAVKSSNGNKRGGWGAIAAGIVGAGVGAAASSSESSKSSTTTKTKSPREDNRKDQPYEYRGAIVEPDSPPRRKGTRSPPSTGPKPTVAQSAHIPGAFGDDLDFTATVAAGLQDTGFDPNIVINDPSFRRRESPPGSNKPSIYQSPFAETVSDLGSIPVTSDANGTSPGFVMGEVPETPKDWRSVSPDNDDSSSRLSKKDQKKRDRAARTQSGNHTPLDEETTSRNLVEEPDSYFETAKLSKKEQKKRDKAARMQEIQSETVTPVGEPSVTAQIVNEPESYFETPKKSKKKSKRNSSTFDEGADDDLRNDRKVSVPVDAFDDLRNADEELNETEKSKKEFKLDSERFDSPSRSTPSDGVVDLGRSSSKKSKDKVRRKSGQYEPETDPTEVTLSPATPLEHSREGELEESRKLRKSSKTNSADRDNSHSIVSAGASRYDDDDYPKSKKKSRSSTKDDVDDTRSIASAPTGDDYEEPKKKQKDRDKRSSGSFFGLFGSKSESGVTDESPRGPKEDVVEAKKKSKKPKRNSVPDGLGLYGDIGSQSGSDLTRASSNGNGHSNGSYYDEGTNGGSPSDDDKKLSRSHTENPPEEDSFLAKAGTLGAGVGLAGAAVAIAAQQYQQYKADNAGSSGPTEQTSPGVFLTSKKQHYETIDPEITQRQFRPSIDPQYGDLLPLPPSDPASPIIESNDDLPSLPDSRPNTPEAERVSRDKALNTIRKSAQETPMKSPSQSAVPLKFIMGNRSMPTSPGLVRSSPMPSPATPREDSLAFPRRPSRPTSWDSTKEYKPLYLVETNRRGSSAKQPELEEVLPSLPPSQSTSRSSSQINFSDPVVGNDIDQPILVSQMPILEPLSIDTTIDLGHPSQDLLGSEQSTPKADMKLSHVDNSTNALHGKQVDESPAFTKSRTLSPESGATALSQESDTAISSIPVDVGLVSSIGYFASSPKHHVTKESWLEELPSRSPLERQPSPVESMSKDRSSYLLQSSPLSRRIEDDPADPEVESPVVRYVTSYTDGDDSSNIQEREGKDIFGDPTKPSPKLEAELPIWPQYERSGDVIAKPETGQEFLDTANREPFAAEELETSTKTMVEKVKLAQDDFVINSKKDRKNDKTKGKDLSRTPTIDDLAIRDSGAVDPRVIPALGDTDYLEDNQSRSSKNDSENPDRSVFSTADDVSLINPSKEEPKEMVAVVTIKATDEFLTMKSKADKKKAKKKAKSMLGWGDEEDTSSSQPTHGVSRDVNDEISHGPPTNDLWTTETKKSKKRDKKTIKPAVSPDVEDRDIADPPESNRDLPLDTLLSEISTTMPAMVGEGMPRQIVMGFPGEETATANDPVVSQEVHASSRTIIAGLDGDIPSLDDVAFVDAKKSKKKKKKGKSALLWEPEGVEDRVPVAIVAPTSVGDFDATSSRKSKKKGTKSDILTLEDAMPVKDSEVSPEDSRTDVGQAVVDVGSERFVQPNSKRNTKKSKRPQTFDFGPESSQSQPIEHHLGVDSASVVHTSRESGVLLSHLANDERQSLESSAGNVNDKSRKDSGNYAHELESSDLKRQIMTSKATPISGPGVETSEPSWREYFPSTVNLHSPQNPRNSDISVRQGYFPSARALLPVVFLTSTVFGVTKSENEPDDVASLSFENQASDSRDLDEPRPEAQPSPPSRNGLKAGYDEEQLSLARRLQEEFGSGSKNSKKDKKKRQSLPSTPGSETSRSRRVIDDTEHPRARSLSTGSPFTENLEASTSGGQRKAIYGEDQLGLARQPKAEFKSGSNKFKKDKKKQPGPLSRSSTQDDSITGHPIEEPWVLATDLVERGLGTDLSEGRPRADGFAAGYKEDQLSLARQLQAEFGSGAKKSKKDRTLRSSSQNPIQESESRDAYFEETLQSSSIHALATNDLTDTANTSTNVKEPFRDGLAVGYSEDQLELARKLKDEFSFGSKKEKKEKKWQTPPRGFSDDNTANDQLPTEPTLTHGIEDISRGIAEINAPEQDRDEFMSAKRQSKKQKKVKKRDSVAAPNVDEKDLPIDVSSFRTTDEQSEVNRLATLAESHSQGLGEAIDHTLEISPNVPTAENEMGKIKATMENDFSDDFGKQVEALHTTNLDSQLSENAGTMPDDTRLSRKWSKKERKKRQSSAAVQATTNILDVTTASEVFDPEAGHPLELSLGQEHTPEKPVPAAITRDSFDEVSISLTPSLDTEDVEFEIMSKKSKKNEKKRQNTESSAFGSSIVRNTEEPPLAQPRLDHLQENEDGNNLQATESGIQSPLLTSDMPVKNLTDTAKTAAEEPFGGYSFTTEKPKKDKRKNKTQLVYELNEGPSASEPLDPISDSIDATAAPHRDDIPAEVKEVKASLAAATARNVVADEPNKKKADDERSEEWGEFALTKSKRNKKKRKSGLSTPVELITAVSEPVRTLEDPHRFVRPDSLDQLVNAIQDAALESVPTAPVEEKKERSSGLSTPLEGSFSSSVSNLAIENGTLQETKASFAPAEPLVNMPQVDYDIINGQPASLVPSLSGQVLREHPSASREPRSDPDMLSTAATQETDPSKTDAMPQVGLGRNALKKDKRKRQETIETTPSVEAVFKEPPVTSWADEVEEAAIERNLPIIEKVARNESLSHVPSTIDIDPANAFVRSTNKGGKGEGSDTSQVESSLKDSSFPPPIGDDAPETVTERKVTSPLPGGAVAGAVAGAALVADNALFTSSENRPSLPTRKLSKKEKRKQSIDRRSVTQNDIFDDPTLWEGDKPRVFKETQGTDDSSGSDGFWSATQYNQDNSIENQIPAIETLLLPDGRPNDPMPIIMDHGSIIKPLIEYVPEQHDAAIHHGILESSSVSKEISGKTTPQTPDIPKSEDQWNDLPDEFVVKSSKEKKKKKQSRMAAWESPEEQRTKTSNNRSIADAIPVPELLQTIAKHPAREERLSHEKVRPTASLRGFDEESHLDKDLSLDKPAPIEHSYAIPLSTGNFDHPGASILPVVREESPIPIEVEHITSHHSHPRPVDETNRDSAFVTDSPVPRQKGFTDDHEHVRDSGVHLRDFSPASISATDDAFARMSWPAVDEETETVDLHRSQQPIAETDTKHREDDDQSTHSSQRERDKYVKHQGENRSLDLPQSHEDVSRDIAGHLDRKTQKLRQERSPEEHLQRKTSGRDLLPSQRNKEGQTTELHRTRTIHRSRSPKDTGNIRQRVERLESPGSLLSQKPKADKYPELNASQRPRAEQPSSIHESSIPAGAALAGATIGFAAARQASREQRPVSVGSNGSSSNINRLRSPDPKYRSDSAAGHRSSGTPPLRRSDRKSGDLRSLSQQSKADLAKGTELPAITAAPAATLITANPQANEGRVRAKDMADVYVSQFNPTAYCSYCYSY